jgi:tetratricopeptide (TPR) repeat protein
LELGLYEESETHSVELLELGKKLGVNRWSIDALLNLGMVYLRRKRLGEAEKALRECAEGYGRIGAPFFQAQALVCLAGVLLAEGNLGAATQVSSEALALSTSEPSAYAPVLATSAQIALRQGHAQEALAAAQEAMELVRSHHLFEFVGLMRSAYIDALFACGQSDEAKAALREAHDWLRKQAEKIDEPSLQQSFLENVPENRHILQLAAQWQMPAA